MATIENELLDFLIDCRGQPFCDDCLKQDLPASPKRKIENAARAIGAAIGFHRATATCVGCGKVRHGTRAQ
jgi:hypothetical protein